MQAGKGVNNLKNIVPVLIVAGLVHLHCADKIVSECELASDGDADGDASIEAKSLSMYW